MYSVETLPALVITKFSAKIKGAAEIAYNYKAEVFLGDVLMQVKSRYYNPLSVPANINLDVTVVALTTQNIEPTAYNGILASINLDVTVI